MITHERLLKIIRYEPDSGLFFRLEQPAFARVDLSLPVGTLRGDGYFVCDLEGKTYYLHRLAIFYVTGVWPKLADHVDGNHGDNRWTNLRSATHQQNAANSVGFPKRRKSAYKGVYKALRGKSNPWCATICVNGKSQHLGSFPTEEDAHAAYLGAAEAHFGEFAKSSIRSAPSASAPWPVARYFPFV